MNQTLDDRPARPRRATPRPVHSTATRIAGTEAAAHLWGDAPSGFVSDRVYTSSDTLHVLEYTLRPGGRFVHSATNPTVFAADVLYIVLEGTLWIADPEHGEVRRVPAGTSVLFHRDTWHHAFNPGTEPVRVLEYFAPPPSRGTASTYARRQPLLETTTYHDTRWARRWPAAAAEREAVSKLHVIGEDDYLWTVVDDHAQHVEGIAVDTEHLTVRHGQIGPGHVSEELTVDDESLLFVTSGVVHAQLPDAPESERAWWRLEPRDALFLPAGTTYRLVELDGSTARYWLGGARPVPQGWEP
ncbi:cupin domain-containing protein [Haloactinopolyspora sp.]|uniref:cupin domain-containing protein n=1 Tax=Haloactinopolyspora sp. TaxID=1966353 RepID=UPI002631E3F6|nr:cupin domain-containing protein [Haloactinopolyspora sp.]